MWKAENYKCSIRGHQVALPKGRKKSGKLECALLSDVYSVVIWRESCCANKQCVLPYPSPLMTSWTNLMPLQYLKDTNCCSLLPPGGATVEKEEEKFRKIARVKKRQTRKKPNEFWRLCKRRAWVWEMNVLIFGVQGFSPHAKKQTLYWCRN